MFKTIAAIYRDASTGQQAVEALLDAGFSGDDISLLVNNTSPMNQRVTTGEGAGFGALIGTLVGIGLALVPGVGPVISAGLLAVALAAGIGAAAGALMGGIAAELLDLNGGEEDPRAYAANMGKSGTIVSLTTHTEWLEWAQRILSRYQPLKIELREAPMRDVEWSRADDPPAETSSRLASQHLKVGVYERNP